VTRTRRPRTAFEDFLQLLWRVPAVSVPFALFFMFTGASPAGQFLGYWLVSMIFAGSISLGIWLTRHTLEARLRGRFPDDPRATWWFAGLYVVVSLFAAVLAAFLVRATLIPDLLGTWRSAVSLLVYTLLFAVLFVGFALATSFYHAAMERAGSEREMQLARRIQRSFLLSEFPLRSRLELHAENVSSREVSGDFYDVVAVDRENVLFAIADVSGKGVPAALLSSMLQASLRTQAAGTARPAAMMSVLNTLACQRVATGQFATFFLAGIHEPSMTLRFTNAGHNFPVLLRPDGTRRLLETGGLVIGMMEGVPYEEEGIELVHGDRIVLYTDGVTEAADAAGEMFGEDRLYALLDSLPRDLPSADVVARVLAGVRTFLAGSEAGDDITVMALRVLPAAADRDRP